MSEFNQGAFSVYLRRCAQAAHNDSGGGSITFYTRPRERRVTPPPRDSLQRYNRTHLSPRCHPRRCTTKTFTLSRRTISFLVVNPITILILISLLFRTQSYFGVRFH
ncbi:hypothetical protein EVAR_55020_1 [Eumeta japonica]|uniref:Uncharacterized protein n=1 Tax=Eumeta variegata TaxID=151549 RepID=A0A4C1YE36_EUMVA|nr:hypothetical protein EVAR_55020_1 [Eumeta japonica]